MTTADAPCYKVCMSLESKAAHSELMGELFSEVREPVAIWSAQGWVCPATYEADLPIRTSRDCVKCEARLGAQNPGDTCDTCKHMP